MKLKSLAVFIILGHFIACGETTTSSSKPEFSDNTPNNENAVSIGDSSENTISSSTEKSSKDSSSALNKQTKQTKECLNQVGSISFDNPCFTYSGRIKMVSDAVLFDWPGTTIYAKFTGTSLKIIMGGGADIFYDVFVNNELVPPLLGNSAIYPFGTFHTNGQEKTFKISSSLPNTEHTLRIVKRTETAGMNGYFKGIELDASAHLVPNKPFTNRKIEFIGDSYVAGYGNQSPSKNSQEKQDASGRDCIGLDLAAYTNTGMAYGPLTAQSLDADFQINAYSGLGMTRHYNGNTSFLPFQDYYKRTLVSDESTLYDFSTWTPDIVVIALGTNDFSTALGSNEIYQTRDDLYIAYQNKYKAFITMIRKKHANVKILALANNLYPDEEMQAQVKSIVDDQKAAGFQDIYFKVLMNTTGYGCGWHPDIATHSSWSKELHTEIENIMNW